MNNIAEDINQESQLTLTQKERYIAGYSLLALTVIMALFYLYG